MSFYKVRAVKGYENVGYVRIDFSTGEAYVNKKASRATLIHEEIASKVVDLLNTGTLDAREGTKFELVPWTL